MKFSRSLTLAFVKNEPVQKCQASDIIASINANIVNLSLAPKKKEGWREREQLAD